MGALSKGWGKGGEWKIGSWLSPCPCQSQYTKLALSDGNLNSQFTQGGKQIIEGLHRRLRSGCSCGPNGSLGGITRAGSQGGAQETQPPHRRNSVGNRTQGGQSGASGGPQKGWKGFWGAPLACGLKLRPAL